MKSQIKSIFRGISQIFLIENYWSGVLILTGIAIGSWSMAVTCFISTVVSTLFAYTLKIPKDKIEAGLYGFNGAIVGAAIPFLYGFTVSALITTFIGAALSSYLMKLISNYVRPLTSPFIVTVWIIATLNTAIDFLNRVGIREETKHLNIFSSIPRGIGQVMFQSSVISGVLIFAAILLENRTLALNAIFGLIVGSLVGVALPGENALVYVGLLSYNAVLVAIALSGNNIKQLSIIFSGCVLSTLIFYGATKTNIFILTSPFVLTTWIILAFQGKLLVDRSEKQVE